MEQRQLHLYQQAGELTLTDRVSRVLMAKAIATAPVYLAVTGAMGPTGLLAILPLLASYPLLTAMVGSDPLYAWADKVKQRRAATAVSRPKASSTLAMSNAG